MSDITENYIAKTADRRIQAQAALDHIQSGAILIDVRNDKRRAEFGLLEGAKLLTKDEAVAAIESNAIGREASTQPVVLFCSSEKGTAQALLALKEAGVENVYDVAGGFQALADKGISVKSFSQSGRGALSSTEDNPPLRSAPKPPATS